MFISKINIRNYRNFSNAQFVFKKGVNTIIGENGSGKTNLFRAIRLLLDDNMLRYAYRIQLSDFNRLLEPWNGHWIIISMEFSEVSLDESIQSLFIHGVGDLSGRNVERATYNMFFRPKPEIRKKLGDLSNGEKDKIPEYLKTISIDDYETVFTGKSLCDFSDDDTYKALVGDFEAYNFNYDIDEQLFGKKIPHQLSISKEISLTFIKALRDVLQDFQRTSSNPLLGLMNIKSEEIDEIEFSSVSESVMNLNGKIENLKDIKIIKNDIEETLKSTVGKTYSPSSLSVRSSLSEEASKLLSSLQLFVGEPFESYEGGLNELSLGGANLIYLTLKLLENKYQLLKRSIANFLLIEEPEAHIHTHIQKSVFKNLEFPSTQIIYSTHSTHISESSRISQMNILSKKINFVEVYQPANGLTHKEIIKVERYLDAIRSNLLFAKGIILVEGDAEEILLPVLVKKILGLSLDELGVSIINIRSVGFLNVACLFHNNRIRKKCSIITDLDKSFNLEVTTAPKRGAKRKEKLENYSKNNEWVACFFAEYTFEVDFMLCDNYDEMIEVSKEIYQSNRKKDNAIENIGSKNLSIAASQVLNMANKIGKGWFAIMLSNYITELTCMPKYIFDAIMFAISDIEKSLPEILSYRIRTHKSSSETLKVEKYIKEYQENCLTLEEVLRKLEEEGFDDDVFEMLKKRKR